MCVWIWSKAPGFPRKMSETFPGSTKVQPSKKSQPSHVEEITPTKTQEMHLTHKKDSRKLVFQEILQKGAFCGNCGISVPSRWDSGRSRLFVNCGFLLVQVKRLRKFAGKLLWANFSTQEKMGVFMFVYFWTGKSGKWWWVNGWIGDFWQYGGWGWKSITITMYICMLRVGCVCVSTGTLKFLLEIYRFKFLIKILPCCNFMTYKHSFSSPRWQATHSFQLGWKVLQLSRFFSLSNEKRTASCLGYRGWKTTTQLY